MDGRNLQKKRDHELIELLNELRVALPGVQVLFAFLLVTPFSARWRHVSATQETAYMVALAATALGSVCLMAPSAYHRLRWRERDKERMLRTSNRLAIGGLACVAVAMTASIYLVTEEVVGTPASWAAAGVAVVVFASAWFLLPLSTPYDRWDDEELDAPVDRDQ